MNRGNLYSLYKRVRPLELNMERCAIRVNQVTGDNCCLLEHACFLAIEDGFVARDSEDTVVNVVGRWLGLSWGDMLTCGWFGREHSSDSAKKAIRKELKNGGITEHLYAGSSVS